MASQPSDLLPYEQNMNVNQACAVKKSQVFQPNDLLSYEQGMYVNQDRAGIKIAFQPSDLR